MADEPIEQPEGDEEILELTEEAPAPEEGEQVETAAQGNDDEDEFVITIGAEAAPASEEAPEWVRDLRKRNRELERELADAKKAKPADVPEVGAKPTLESCEYDEERFDQEYDAWKIRKSAAENAQTEAQKAEEAARERYEGKVNSYGDAKASLGIKDFDQAEAEVLANFSDAQKAIVIHGAEQPAKLVYALGKHPEKLRQLASITDPIEFAFAASKLETQTKMERRPRTSPESHVRGSAPLAGQGNKELQRLEAEAERTGNRTQVIAFKRRQKARGQG
jgi:hypothetical protein